jgi:K+-sensing histidine kinase KdpD
MRIGQRMYLAMFPALLGVFTVVGLAYWGQYARAAPVWIVVVAAIATIASFVAAWSNARYVTSRVERLASTRALGAPDQTTQRHDELETIETVVHHLSTAMDEAAAVRQAERHALRDQQRAYGDLLAVASRDALQRLDEIRLPLHILRENHFGDLNENQEEMLGSARTATEQAGDAFQRLEEIGNIDQGASVMRRDRVRPGDLIAGFLPALVAEGQQKQIRVSAEVAPAIQAIPGDRGRLQSALGLLLQDCLRRSAADGDAQITVDLEGRNVLFAVRHGDGAPEPIAAALGQRIVAAHGGSVVERVVASGKRVTEIRLPTQ